ncbi:hypothetical protein V8E52_004713 [Russula decolorans]
MTIMKALPMYLADYNRCFHLSLHLPLSILRPVSFVALLRLLSLVKLPLSMLTGPKLPLSLVHLRVLLSIPISTMKLLLFLLKLASPVNLNLKSHLSTLKDPLSLYNSLALHLTLAVQLGVIEKLALLL